MNTRKIFALLTAVALLFSCVALAEEEPAKVQTGIYTIKNKTGVDSVESAQALLEKNGVVL